MVVHEPDDWSVEEQKINSREQLAKVAAAIEKSVVIVEHRHYRGSSAPNRLFFEEYDEFIDYLQKHGCEGDAFRIWSFDDVCCESNVVVEGKYPDSKGRVPRKGAY
jgi:hypothetical protein